MIRQCPEKPKVNTMSKVKHTLGTHVNKTMTEQIFIRKMYTFHFSCATLYILNRGVNPVWAAESGPSQNFDREWEWPQWPGPS